MEAGGGVRAVKNSKKDANAKIYFQAINRPLN